MISLEVYKLIHVLAILFVFSAIAGVAVHTITGGRREDNPFFRVLAIVHGLAIVFILVSGFGMLARIGVAHNALTLGWIWVKLGVWAVLGALLTLPYRRSAWARPIFFVTPLLGVLAASMAILKPF